MAQQTMGQMYTGDAFGEKWNWAYGDAWRMIAGSLFDLSVEDIPQEPFDDLLSLVFWSVVDNEYGGKVPKRIESICDVPERCDKPLEKVLIACRGCPQAHLTGNGCAVCGY